MQRTTPIKNENELYPLSNATNKNLNPSSLPMSDRHMAAMNYLNDVPSERKNFAAEKEKWRLEKEAILQRQHQMQTELASYLSQINQLKSEITFYQKSKENTRIFLANLIHTNGLSPSQPIQNPPQDPRLR